MPLIITGIGVCAVRVLWIMFVLPHYHTIIGAAFCYPFDLEPDHGCLCDLLLLFQQSPDAGSLSRLKTLRRV